MFRLCNPQTKTYSIVTMHNVPYQPNYVEDIIGQDQLRDSAGFDVQMPAKEINEYGEELPTSRPMIITHNSKEINRITKDPQDNLYYVYIMEASTLEKMEAVQMSETCPHENQATCVSTCHYGPRTLKSKKLTVEEIHNRYGHPLGSKMTKMIHNLYELGYEISGSSNNYECMACNVAKMKPLPYPTLPVSRKLDTKPGEKWSHDLSGKMSIDPICYRGSKYRSLAIDYYSGMVRLEFLHNKSDAINHIKRIEIATNKNFGNGRFSTLKTDGAGELGSNET